MTTITALPDPPSRADPSNFRSRADALLSALPDFVTETNAVAGEVNTNATTASTGASTATTKAAEAAASAAAAQAASNAAAWVSGTTYAEGAVVWSPATHLSYRRKVAGAGTTDPSADQANWAALNAGRTWLTKTANYTAAAGEAILADTSGGAWTLTLPASASAGDTVVIVDAAGTFATNNLTIGCNALKIMGLSEDMTVSTNNAAFELVYSGATYGWRVL